LIRGDSAICPVGVKCVRKDRRDLFGWLPRMTLIGQPGCQQPQTGISSGGLVEVRGIDTYGAQTKMYAIDGMNFTLTACRQPKRPA
jgi:hypothetical protein